MYDNYDEERASAVNDSGTDSPDESGSAPDPIETGTENEKTADNGIYRMKFEHNENKNTADSEGTQDVSGSQSGEGTAKSSTASQSEHYSSSGSQSGQYSGGSGRYSGNGQYSSGQSSSGGQSGQASGQYTSGQGGYGSGQSGYSSQSGQYGGSGSYGNQSGQYGSGQNGYGSQGRYGSQSGRYNGQYSSGQSGYGSQYGQYGGSGSYGNQSGQYGSGQNGYGSQGGYGSQSGRYNGQYSSGQGGYGNPNSQYGSQNTYSNQNGQTQKDAYNGQQTQANGAGGNGYTAYRETGSGAPKKPKKKKSGGTGRQLVKVVCFALIFGLIAGVCTWGVNNLMGTLTGTSTADTSDTSDTTGYSLNVVRVSTTDVETIEGTDVSDIVAEVMPSIVAVTTIIETTTSDFLGRTYSSESSGAGSGIIFSESDDILYILTNYHVIEDASSVTITFCDDTSAEATVMGYSESDDIAVLELDMSQLSDDTKSSIAIAVMGDSDEVQEGDGAIAIGNALGYGQSVTTGTISAVNREVSMTDGTMVMIQTDAAINEGNSGGALLNTKGEVIGINSAKLYGTTIEGMGYAIPINTALEVVDQILSGELVNKTDEETAALGILGGTVSETYVENYGYPAGVYVSQVYSNSAAELAGIEAGYIITGFNGVEITSMDELQAALAECSPGDTATIDVMIPGSDGTYTESRTLTTTLGSAADMDTSSVVSGSSDSSDSSDDSGNYGNYGDYGDNFGGFGN